MEQLTKNQAVATSQEAVQNQNEPQLRDENAHNDKSVHGVLNPTYQAGLRRDAVQPDIEAERKKSDEIKAGKSYSSRRFGGAACDDKSAQIYLTSKEAKMGKVMRHTLGASLNIRHNLSSSKGPKPLQLKLLTTYIPKTSAFTLAFSTSQRLRTTRASARTFFTFRHYITPSA